MPLPAKSTYSVRMGCENCGFITLYDIARGYEITDACRCQECEQYSSYHAHKSDKKTLMFCINCNVPALKVFWSAPEEPARQPQEFAQ